MIFFFFFMAFFIFLKTGSSLATYPEVSKYDSGKTKSHPYE